MAPYMAPMLIQVHVRTRDSEQTYSRVTVVVPAEYTKPNDHLSHSDQSMNTLKYIYTSILCFHMYTKTSCRSTIVWHTKSFHIYLFITIHETRYRGHVFLRSITKTESHMSPTAIKKQSLKSRPSWPNTPSPPSLAVDRLLALPTTPGWAAVQQHQACVYFDDQKQKW